MSNRRLLMAAVVLLVVTGGCVGAGGGGGGANEQSAELVQEKAGGTGTPMATEAAADAPEEDGGSSVSSDAANGPPSRARAIIFTGHVSIEVADFERARENLTRTVESLGGYVSDARKRVHEVDNESFATGQLTLRVPRENFTAMMERAKSIGDLLSSSRESKDVTDQLVDIEARLKNLRAQRDRLRQLYRNATDTEAILQVEERLSEVQTRIERLAARRKSLRERVAMSTITVELREPEPETDPDPIERWYDTGVIAAFLDSVHGVVVTLRALVVALAYAFPYLLVFGTPLAVGGYFLKRYVEFPR